jgi:hypothetical protein
MSFDLDALLAAIRPAPDLPRANCRNRSRLFDEQPHSANGERNERRALHLCARCEELPRCARWLATLPPNARPLGVVAGAVQRRAKHEQRKPSPAQVPPVSRRYAAAMAALAEWEANTGRKRVGRR